MERCPVTKRFSGAWRFVSTACRVQGYTLAVRSEGRLGLRQVVVFVAVAFVLNVQFTWWVLHALRENGEWLALERGLLHAREESAAATLVGRAQGAALHLASLPPGVIPSTFEPFLEVRVVEEGTAPSLRGGPPEARGAGGEGGAATIPGPVAEGWTERDGQVLFRRPLGRGRQVLAVLDTEAPRRWLAALDPELRLVAAGTAPGELPSVTLDAPLQHWSVTADEKKWAEVMARYRRRVVVVVAQGVLMVGAMVAAVVLLWTALRREGRRERQHQNFVSAITHELKTPLAGIRLALETVLSGRVDEEGRERFLTNALIDAERLSDLVQKVLEVTRYAGGAHRLAVELGDFSDLVSEEVTAARRRAVARGVALEADIAEGIQAPYDSEAMAIVCSNLIENALKYATRGEPPRVDVSLRLLRGEAVLEVRDNGVGIATADLETIFQPFYRANDEVTRRTPGTGIGLYVAREIVLAHGGRLTASSPGAGKGATFRLVLPGASPFSDEEDSE
jgi:signal transduction histidine kinase